MLNNSKLCLDQWVYPFERDIVRPVNIVHEAHSVDGVFVVPSVDDCIGNNTNIFLAHFLLCQLCPRESSALLFPVKR